MSAISPERWREISPYLDHVLSLSEGERAAWIDSLRTQHADTAALLEDLLKEHRALDQEHFLEQSPVSPLLESSLAGQTVGAYKLISPIGQGGMGTVWLAERSDGRFDRRVAIKFVNFAVAAQGAERFQREGRILARIAHPHIAELIDAGVMASGQAYLVLEYVEGKAVDEYCGHHKLDLDARIKLFLDVLDAVAHAHANLVVHRDIKPSNVMVSTAGEVKLLDFGIAKLLADETDPAGATMLTVAGGAGLTPLFAAPEQVSGGAITTATDVYALGVLLYLLLTGRHPAGPGPHSPADLVKAITETVPPRASDAVVSSGESEEVGPAASNRSATPDKLRRMLRGDLDTIVAKALKKNPEERYSSVIAFADDLRRYLNHEPIKARPDTLGYRAAKFARRNRAGVVVAAVLLLFLAGFAAVQRLELRRITRERDRANRITEFMTNMFKGSDPSKARGNTITAREILDKASKDIDTGLINDPELQAQMMDVMGNVYDDLGLYPTAESLLTRAFNIRRNLLGAEHSDTLESECGLGWVLQEEGHYAQAEKLLRQALNGERRTLGSESPATLESLSHLAATLNVEKRFTEAEKLHRDAFDIEQRVLGPDNSRTLSEANNLAADLDGEGRYAEAERLQRDLLNRELRVVGPKDPITLTSIHNLSFTLCREGRCAEAEKLQRDALDTDVRVLGPEHPNTLEAMANLGLFLKREGHLADAEKLLWQTLDLDRRVFGPNHVETASELYNLGCIAALQGKRDQAFTLLRKSVDHGLIPPYDSSLLEQDTDLKALRGDPRFAALIADARQRTLAPKVH